MSHTKSAMTGRPADNGGTDRYYELNAVQYFRETRDADVSALYEHFLNYLDAGARILDAGCGSGRDTLAFLKRGYCVEAFDASPKLASLASQLSGIQVAVKRFEEFSEDNRYEGIWACASLLHVLDVNLHGVITRLANALRVNGVIYMSFKLGSGVRVAEDGRRFTDMNEDRLRSLIRENGQLIMRELWITGGEDKFKGRDSWINAVASRGR